MNEDFSSSKKQDHSGEENLKNVHLNYCFKHEKEAELICLTDKTLICTECVLFDNHKNHDYVKNQEFAKTVDK